MELRTEGLTVIVIVYKDKIRLTDCGYFIRSCNNIVPVYSFTFIYLPYVTLPHVGLLNNTL
jgi:hypothetical protein